MLSMAEHTSKQFDSELETVRTQVLKMGGLVESQTVAAINALMEGDITACTMVINNDQLVNTMEIELDEDCSRIIARRQPTAGDLRLLLTVVKVISDLERIGDEASKIARMAKQIYAADRLQTPRFNEIKQVADIALGMLKSALDSFARSDISVAAKVVREDERVDDAFRGIIRQLITFMMEDPRTISSSLDILFIAKAIERIGDHAKNIAEYVIYMVKGKDVRHTSPEEIEREILV